MSQEQYWKNFQKLFKFSECRWGVGAVCYRFKKNGIAVKICTPVSLFMLPNRKIGGHIVLPLSVRPSVCLHKLNVKT